MNRKYILFFSFICFYVNSTIKAQPTEYKGDTALFSISGTDYYAKIFPMSATSSMFQEYVNQTKTMEFEFTNSKINLDSLDFKEDPSSSFAIFLLNSKTPFKLYDLNGNLKIKIQLYIYEDKSLTNVKITKFNNQKTDTFISFWTYWNENMMNINNLNEFTEIGRRNQKINYFNYYYLYGNIYPCFDEIIKDTLIVYHKNSLFKIETWKRNVFIQKYYKNNKLLQTNKFETEDIVSRLKAQKYGDKLFQQQTSNEKEYFHFIGLHFPGKLRHLSKKETDKCAFKFYSINHSLEETLTKINDTAIHCVYYPNSKIKYKKVYILNNRIPYQLNLNKYVDEMEWEITTPCYLIINGRKTSMLLYDSINTEPFAKTKIEINQKTLRYIEEYLHNGTKYYYIKPLIFAKDSQSINIQKAEFITLFYSDSIIFMKDTSNWIEVLDYFISDFPGESTWIGKELDYIPNYNINKTENFQSKRNDSNDNQSHIFIYKDFNTCLYGLKTSTNQPIINAKFTTLSLANSTDSIWKGETFDERFEMFNNSGKILFSFPKISKNIELFSNAHKTVHLIESKFNDTAILIDNQATVIFSYKPSEWRNIENQLWQKKSKHTQTNYYSIDFGNIVDTNYMNLNHKKNNLFFSNQTILQVSYNGINSELFKFSIHSDYEHYLLLYDNHSICIFNTLNDKFSKPIEVDNSNSYWDSFSRQAFHEGWQYLYNCRDYHYSAHSSNQRLFKFSKNNRWGVLSIDDSLEVVIGPEYDAIGELFAIQNKDSFLINTERKKTIPVKNLTVNIIQNSFYAQQYILAKNAESTNLYDLCGNKLNKNSIVGFSLCKTDYPYIVEEKNETKQGPFLDFISKKYRYHYGSYIVPVLFDTIISTKPLKTVNPITENGKTYYLGISQNQLVFLDSKGNIFYSTSGNKCTRLINNSIFCLDSNSQIAEFPFLNKKIQYPAQTVLVSIIDSIKIWRIVTVANPESNPQSHLFNTSDGRMSNFTALNVTKINPDLFFVRINKDSAMLVDSNWNIKFPTGQYCLKHINQSSKTFVLLKSHKQLIYKSQTLELLATVDSGEIQFIKHLICIKNKGHFALFDINWKKIADVKHCTLEDIWKSQLNSYKNEFTYSGSNTNKYSQPTNDTNISKLFKFLEIMFEINSQRKFSIINFKSHFPSYPDTSQYNSQLKSNFDLLHQENENCSAKIDEPFSYKTQCNSPNFDIRNLYYCTNGTIAKIHNNYAHQYVHHYRISNNKFIDFDIVETIKPESLVRFREAILTRISHRYTLRLYCETDLQKLLLKLLSNNCIITKHGLTFIENDRYYGSTIPKENFIEFVKPEYLYLWEN